MSTQLFKVEEAQDLLLQINNASPKPLLEAEAIPIGEENTKNLLSFLFDSIESNELIAPLMALSASGEIIVLKEIKEHTFPRSPAISFASKIAPVQNMGVFQIELANLDSTKEPLVLPTTWITGNFDNSDVAKETIVPESMVYFPHSWLYMLAEEPHLEKIDPTILLREVIRNRYNVHEKIAEQVIKFLIQSIVGYIPTLGFNFIEGPIKRGKSTWDLLLSNLRIYQPIPINTHTNDAESTIDEEESNETDILQNNEEDTKFSPNSKKMFIMLKAQFSSLNETMIKNLVQVSESKSSNILRLEDKEGFLKKLPDHAKDVFINLRASKALPNPKELDSNFSGILAKIKSKSHAYEQIIFTVAKAAGKRDLDCLIDAQTLENFFKFGEVRNRRPITSFEKSFGLNNFALGPSGPSKGTFQVTSDTGNKHISFIASNVSELITAYKNLKFFVNFITGTNDSFASIGLAELIHFLDDNAITIKESSKDIPNFVAELQIQTGNTWARFIANCAHESPKNPPDFSHFIESVESGRTFAPVLRSVDVNNPTSNNNSNKKARLGKDDKKSGKEPNRANIINNSPQLFLEGNSDQDKENKFRRIFPDRNTIKNMKFSTDEDNKAICLHFHILHRCGFKPCHFSHKPLSNEMINKIMNVSKEKHLGISKK